MSEESKIKLNLDEENQLLFKMKVKGSDKSPSTVRLVFEGAGYAYSIPGSPAGVEDDVYKFDVPALHSKLDEGSYRSRVEVIVDGRYFAPVEFETEFKRPMQVQAESLVVTRGVGKQVERLAETRPVAVKEDAKTTVVVEMSPQTKNKYSSLRDKYKAGK